MQYQFAEFTLDTDTGTVTGPEGTVPLRRRTWELLKTLVEHAPALVTRDRILDEVWGHDALTPNVLPQAIGEIRQALGDSAQSPRLIETRHRRGYRLLVPVGRIAGGNHAAAASPVSVSGDAQVAPGSFRREATPTPPSTVLADANVAPAPPRAAASRDRRWWPAIALVLLLLAIPIVLWLLRDPGADRPDATRPAIALMIQAEPESAAWLSAAGTELLAVALGGDNQVRLLRGDGRSDVPAMGDTRWQSWLREVLRADYALTGLWRLEGDRPVLVYSLLRLDDSQIIHGGQVERDDLALVGRQVADEVRRRFRLQDTGSEALAGLPAARQARDAYYRGLAALADGRSGDAVAALEVAAADVAAGARVKLALAKAYRSSGHVGKARELFEAILASDHGLNPREQLQLEAERARVNYRPADAAASLLALHRLTPDNPEVAYDLIEAQIRARQAGAAATTLRGLEALSGESSQDPRWHLAQAELETNAFRLDEATASAEQALALAERFGLDELVAMSQLQLVALDRRKNLPQSAGERLQRLLQGKLTPWQRVRTLLQQGNLLRDLGQLDDAEAAIGQAIELAGEHGNRAQQMLARVELHTVKSQRSHSEQTLLDLEALEPAILELEDPGLLARYYNTLGVQANLNKEIDKAQTYLERAAVQARKAGQIDNEAGVYNNLGLVLSRNERTDDAIRAWEQALRVFSEVDNRLGQAITLSNLGSASVTKGNLAQARDQYRRALDLFEALNSEQHIARTSFDLGQVNEREGRLSEAAVLYEQALADQRDVVVDRALHAAAALARARLAMGDLAAARAVLADADGQLQASSEPGAQAMIHTARGHVALLAGDGAAARSAFEQARALRERSKDPADKVAQSDLDVLALDLMQRQPAQPIQVRAERLHRQMLRQHDVRGQIMALLVQAGAMLLDGRIAVAEELADGAQALLSGYPDAGLAHEIARVRILADASSPATRKARLLELAAEAESEGFVSFGLRCRLDADPADAGTLDRIAASGLTGLLRQ